MLDNKISLFIVIGLCYLSAAIESNQNYTNNNDNNHIIYKKTEVFLRNKDNVILTCSERHRIVITAAFLSYLTDIDLITPFCGKNIVREVRDICFANGVNINSCPISTLQLPLLSKNFICNESKNDESIIISFQCYQDGFVSICSNSDETAHYDAGFIEPPSYGSIVPSRCSEENAGVKSCPSKQCESRWRLPSNANRATLEITLLDLHFSSSPHLDEFNEDQKMKLSSTCDPDNSDVLAVKLFLPDKAAQRKSLAEWCVKELEMVPKEKRVFRLDGVTQVLNARLTFSRDYLSVEHRRGFLLHFKVTWCAKLVAPHNTIVITTSELNAELRCIPGTTLSGLSSRSHRQLDELIDQVQQLECRGGDEGWRPTPRPCVPVLLTTTSSVVSHSLPNVTTPFLPNVTTPSLQTIKPYGKVEVKPFFTEKKFTPALVGGGLGFLVMLGIIVVAIFLWRHSKQKRLQKRIDYLKRLSTAGLTGPLILNNETHPSNFRVAFQMSAQTSALPPVPSHSLRGSTAPLLQSSCEGSLNDSLPLHRGSSSYAAPLANLREMEDMDSSAHKIDGAGGLLVRLPSFRSRCNCYGEDDLAENNNYNDWFQLRRAPSAETYLEPSMLPSTRRFRSLSSCIYYDSATCVCQTDSKMQEGSNFIFDAASAVSNSDPDILDIYEIYEEM